VLTPCPSTRVTQVGPTQVLTLALLEVVVYAANKRFLLIELIGIADIGGTVVIHCFGAYFGLAAAWVLGVPKDDAGDSDSSSISDIFSLIGTVFLWLYWPSFVTAMPGDSAQETTALLNTVFALLASTVTTFGISAWMERSIRPVDIQNATLAGGVAVGAPANFALSPTGALGVGALAGLISALGFIKVQPMLEGKGLHDSCGVHNLHGMPSVLGALISFVFLLINDDCKLNGSCQEEGQAVMQLVALGVTVAVAVLTGALTGAVLKAIGQPERKFVDQSAWSASPPPTGPATAPNSPPKIDAQA
jgi:ammonium transporter Rh